MLRWRLLRGQLLMGAHRYGDAEGQLSWVMDEPPVSIFTMGANVWRTEPEWPVHQSSVRPFYLLREADNGGTRGAPKFPQAALFELLWRAGQRTGEARYFAAACGGMYLGPQQTGS